MEVVPKKNRGFIIPKDEEQRETRFLMAVGIEGEEAKDYIRAACASAEIQGTHTIISLPGGLFEIQTSPPISRRVLDQIRRNATLFANGFQTELEPQEEGRTVHWSLLYAAEG